MKQMKKTLFTTVILMAFILNVKGQEEKDLAVSVGTGLLNSPAYENASAKGFFRIDFDYHVTSRHSSDIVTIPNENVVKNRGNNRIFTNMF
jgi:hypothetical protein